jgi:hypothetical protein
MNLTLTSEETGMLLRHLARQIEHMDQELVHTDKRDLQRALARDVDALRALTARIRAAEVGVANAAAPDVV